MVTGQQIGSKRAGFLGSMAVALGIGAAMVGGIGTAYADGPADGSTAGRNPAAHSTTASPARQAVRDTHRTIPVGVRKSARSTRPGPAPDDHVSTDYGDIGKWMRKANGQIADWGGKRYGGKTLLETVNVLIVDPHSTTAAQAARGLNDAMLRSQFPAQPLHSNGFRADIDQVTYGQKPTSPLLAYSDGFFLLPNNHGRFFGPDPIETDAGFVWSGAFSTERVGFSGLIPGHVYVSSNGARDAVAKALITSGQATYGGLVPLQNAYNTASSTTGDHDGFAVVLVLTGNAPLQRRELTESARPQQSTALLLRTGA